MLNSEMTINDVFNKAANAIIKQGRPSVDTSIQGRNICFYRSMDSDGKPLKCAVGHLIPDEAYTEEMEGNSCSAEVIETILNETYPLANIEYLAASTILRQLQVAHDNAAVLESSATFILDFKAHVNNIADQYYDLTFIEEQS